MEYLHLLLVRDRLNADVLFAYHPLELIQQFGAQVGGIVGKFDQVPAPVLENVQGEMIPAGIRDERPMQAADAALVAEGVIAGTQDGGDHLRGMIGIQVRGRRGWARRSR